MASKVKRTRRNVLKAAGVLVGAVAAGGKNASAQWHGWGGGGGGGSACFLRGTRIKTSKGYRRIETLVAGDLLPTRFGGLAPIKKIDSFIARQGDANRPVRVRRGSVRIAPDGIDDTVRAATCNRRRPQRAQVPLAQRRCGHRGSPHALRRRARQARRAQSLALARLRERCRPVAPRSDGRWRPVW